MAMHPGITANVLELQAIKLLLFGIADRTEVPQSWVKDVFARLEAELIDQIEQKESEKNGDTKSSEGGL